MRLTYDVIIVGGGPAGLSAGLLLGRCCRRVLRIVAAAEGVKAACAINSAFQQERFARVGR